MSGIPKRVLPRYGYFAIISYYFHFIGCPDAPLHRHGIARRNADREAPGHRGARRGFRIGYEALAWGRHVNKFGHAWKIVQAAAHPAIGLVVDSFHTFAVEDDDATIAKIPGDRIFFAQLADAPLMRLDPLSWSRHFRLFPGQGAFPVTRFAQHLLASGYDGPISLGVLNDQ